MDINIMGEIGYDVYAPDVINEINNAQEEITLHILSGGGSAFHGFGIYDALKASSQKVTAKIYGLAASAASVIAMGADDVQMGDGAFLMIHEAWNVAIGDAKDLRDSADLLDKMNARLNDVYGIKTGLPSEQLAGLISAETWMSADEAMELGFVNSKMTHSDIAASIEIFTTHKKTSTTTKTKKEAKNMAELDEKEKGFLGSLLNKLGMGTSEPVAVAAAPVAAVVTEPVAKSDNGDLKKFVNAFGNENGARYLLGGKSFEEAQNSFIAGLNEQKEKDAADIKAKDEEILTLKNQLSEAIGGADPIASTPLSTKETPKTHARIQGDK